MRRVLGLHKSTTSSAVHILQGRRRGTTRLNTAPVIYPARASPGHHATEHGPGDATPPPLLTSAHSFPTVGAISEHGAHWASKPGTPVFLVPENHGWPGRTVFVKEEQAFNDGPRLGNSTASNVSFDCKQKQWRWQRCVLR